MPTVGSDYHASDIVPEELISLYGVNPLLAVLFLHEQKHEFLRTYFLQSGSTECFERILEMICVANGSRHSSLQLLLNSSRDMFRPYWLNLDSINISLSFMDRALLLPPDDESIPLIRPLALSTRYPIDRIAYTSARIDLRRAVLQRAKETEEALMGILASRVVFGRINGRTLSCARGSKDYIPTTGWLAPYVD